MHRKLGPLQWTVWNEKEETHQIEVEDQPEKIQLLDLPDILREKGFQAIEICHFHFRQTNAHYLHKLREACKKANITFHTLLVDYGDLSSADEERRTADIKWIKKWIHIAHESGAERVRIIAGEGNPEDRDAINRSIDAFKELLEYAKPLGIQILSENFLSLTSTAENCLKIIHETDEQIRMITDFGNFTGNEKYKQLEKILPYSDSVHAKAHFNQEGIPDKEEFQKCLNLLEKTGYKGPITLIYDGPGNMWQGIDRVREIVKPYL